MTTLGRGPPTFKKVSVSSPGTAEKYGADDIRYAFDVLDETHPSHRVQAVNIEHVIHTHDVVIHQNEQGTIIYARKADGTLIDSGDADGVDDTRVIQSAFNEAFISGTSGPTKPTTILMKKGHYKTGALRPRMRSNTTLIGVGADSILWQVINNSETNVPLGAIQTDLPCENVHISGIKFDGSNISQRIVHIQGNENAGGSNNSTVRDCVFVRPGNADPDNPNRHPNADGRSLMFRCTRNTGFGDDAITLERGENFRVINCDFDNTGVWSNVQPLQFTNATDVVVLGCRFWNNTQPQNTTISVYGGCRNVVLAHNDFRNNTVPDVLLSQATNIRVIGNSFANELIISDSQYIDIIGNFLRFLNIRDKVDSADPHYDFHEAIWVGTQHVNVFGNTFDSTIPGGMSGLNPNVMAIQIRTAGTGPGSAGNGSPIRNINIVGNEAIVDRGFVYMEGVADNMPEPNENIVVAYNHVAERFNSASTSIATIDMRANTTANPPVPAGGLRNLYVINNYFPVRAHATTNQTDVNIASTDMQNIVVRGNWLNGNGVTNINSFPHVADNIAGSSLAAQTHSSVGTGATISSGNTSVTVNHGLGYTPSLDNIMIVPTNNMGSASRFWVSNPTSTQFTINVNTAPGGSGASFSWAAARQ